MHTLIAVTVFALTPPLTGVAIILFDRHPPHYRSTLGFGMTFILAAAFFAALGMSSAILDGRQPFFPYLLLPLLPMLAVIRLMQLQFKRERPHQQAREWQAVWELD